MKDLSSQEEHLRRCRSYADSQGWEVVAERIDTASGFKRDVVRPGWEQVRALVEKKQVDVVLIFAMSRAGRNAASLLAFVEQCRDNEVKLVSATEPIDTGSAYGTIIISVLAAVAEIESAMKSERALLGRDVAKREGTWSGGRRPYGFRPVKDNGRVRLVLDEQEADHVRLAAEVVLNGGSLVSAAQAMNDAGARTITGQPWYGASIGPLLSRESNAPDILTPSTLSKVQRAVKKREPVKGRRPRYLLTGLAYCGICGAKLKGKPVGDVPKYVCASGTDVHPKGATWTNPKTGEVVDLSGKPIGIHLSMRADVADREVLSRTELLVPPAPEQVEDPGEVPEDLAAELRDIEARLEELYGQAETKQISEREYRGRTRPLEARAEELETQIEAALPASGRWAELFRELSEHGPGAATPDEKREWVEHMVARVVIRPGRKDRVELFLREGVTAQPRA